MNFFKIWHWFYIISLISGTQKSQLVNQLWIVQVTTWKKSYLTEDLQRHLSGLTHVLVKLPFCLNWHLSVILRTKNNYLFPLFIVGDDSTCEIDKHEICRTHLGVSSCDCKPGYGRVNHRKACKSKSALFFLQVLKCR